MENYNDNKATPTKRTGVKNNNLLDTGKEKDDNTIQTIGPEIRQPNPASATPTIPAEMPARNIR